MSTQKWYLPVAITALLWNIMGCVAYILDATISPEDIAQLTAAQQAAYASRSAWVVSATAIAVWGGAAGCVGLVWRKRWATWLLVASLAGVIVQDLGIFVLSDAASQAGATAMVLQGFVLVIAVGLVFLGRRAAAEGWIS